MALHILAHILFLVVIAYLCYDPALGMLNRSGGRLFVVLLALPCLIFGATLVFADVNRLKKINEATGNHMLTNALLRKGLRVRLGEFAWQVFGDEFAFVIWGDGQAFTGRIARQLAAQPLDAAQRRVLLNADGVDYLSATFAIVPGTRNLWKAMEQGSVAVLAQKAARDGRVRA